MSFNSVGGNQQKAGEGVRGEHILTSPAQFTVGAVRFEPHWSNAEDAMAASIVRLECQKEELNAEVALLREQARIMHTQNNELREVMAEIVTWIEDDLRGTVDAGYRKAVEQAQKLTEGLR